MKIFIAGPRAISKLNEDICKRLLNISANDFTVLIGDANGVDKAVQKFYVENGYCNVKVYVSGSKARNNEGHWEQINVNPPNKTKGFDFYTAKDYEMAKDSDYGFMIWNGKSKGTLNNIINLINMEKTVALYFTPEKKFYKLDSYEDLKIMMSKIKDEELIIFYKKKTDIKEQIKMNI